MLHKKIAIEIGPQWTRCVASDIDGVVFQAKTENSVDAKGNYIFENIEKSPMGIHAFFQYHVFGDLKIMKAFLAYLLKKCGGAPAELYLTVPAGVSDEGIDILKKSADACKVKKLVLIPTLEACYCSEDNLEASTLIFYADQTQLDIGVVRDGKVIADGFTRLFEDEEYDLERIQKELEYLLKDTAGEPPQDFLIVQIMAKLSNGIARRRIKGMCTHHTFLV